MTAPAENYRYEFVTRDVFDPVFANHHTQLYGDILIAETGHFYSEEEKERQKILAAPWQDLVMLDLLVYDGDALVGWSTGNQAGKETFYMRNSAVLPPYRRQGVYTAMMARMIDKAASLGFQEISSRHHPTNNAVIIPKLKAGFVIAGIEVNARFGTLVQLVYFTRPELRALFDFRVGRNPGGDTVRRSLGLISETP